LNATLSSNLVFRDRGVDPLLLVVIRATLAIAFVGTVETT
jgi:hypothetical protein